MEAVELNDTSGIPWGLESKDFDPEKHSTDAIVVDDNVVEDVLHGIVRDYSGEAEPFTLIPLIAEVYDEAEVFVDYDVFDTENSSYSDPLLPEESLQTIEEFMREYTTDLGLDEWADDLGLEGDDLYAAVAEEYDAALLTYDGDFTRNDRAITPAGYLEGWREE